MISRKTIPYRTGRYGQYFPYRYLGRYKNVAIPEPFRLYRRKIRISAGKEKKRKKIKTLSSLATTDPVTDTTPISEFSAFSSRPHVATTTAQSSSFSFFFFFFFFFSSFFYFSLYLPFSCFYPPLPTGVDQFFTTSWFTF